MSEQPQEQNGQSVVDSALRWRMSRRGFLIGMAATGATLALGIPLGLPALRRLAAGLTEGDAGGFARGTLDPLLWFQLYADERVLLFVPKAEMGQGIHTALAQIAAEELEVPWDRLEVVHASTSQASADFRGTSGSMSVSSLYNPLRQAAATLREMLRSEASRVLSRRPDELLTDEGSFHLKTDPSIRITYGELVAGGVDWQVPSEDVELKRPSEHSVIGQSLPRVDMRAKVLGRAVFGYDARADGLLYGAVAHRPTLEAQMRGASPGEAQNMPGVVKVVIEDGFAGVVARSRTQAWAARDALDVDWDEGRLWQQADLEQLVSVGDSGGVSIQRVGNARSALKRGQVVSAEFRTGMAAHASMEPQAALADIGANGGRVWTSTQSETSVQRDVAAAIGLAQDQIEIVPTFLGGGFGRKIELRPVSSVAVEAARLSKAVGAPVHVGWTRAEEMRNGFVRPLTHHLLQATLDDRGRIAAIWHQQASADALFAVFPELVGRILGFDFGSTRGTHIPYDIANREVTAFRIPTPVPTGSWRGLGLMANVFALETFMDELAHATGVDPVQFRLSHLPANSLGQRMRTALEAAAERAGWGQDLPEGRARGVACAADGGTVVAEVAEVSLDRDTGRIRVHRVVAAVDPGRVINPDGATAQTEGNVVMGTSATLLEEITVSDGRVEAANFNRYPLLRMADAPVVETILLQSAEGKPTGLGEPPIAPIAAAIGNALFALTGWRVRRLPMTPERVLEAGSLATGT